jgi:hypothetical protein
VAEDGAMTEVLTLNAKQQFLDNNGRPLVSGKLFTYQAGTSTKQTTYKSSSGLSSNTNPIILDYRGECDLWIPPNVSYKYVLAPASDTDPPANPIWTVDNVVSSQLITLYGGVDSGVANAYVLTFTANFTAYTDGIVIYWIPSNTNTTASTINVNGLGIVSIVNQNGAALSSSQLVANQVATIMYKGGQFLLISSGITPSVVTGSFVPTWTGFSVAPNCNIFYTKIGGLITLTFDASGTTGTSNTTAMTITNLPTILRPQTSSDFRVVCTLTDNGAQSLGAFGFGATPGTIVFYKGSSPSASGFTNSGSKGFAPYTPLIYTSLI